jgi:hypothetical protein
MGVVEAGHVAELQDSPYNGRENGGGDDDNG